jgi:hypothetical protein
METSAVDLKDQAGRRMQVSHFVLEEARARGWTSEIADETLAQALDKATWDDDSPPSAGAEAASIVWFVRGGPAYNAAFRPAVHPRCDDPQSLRWALQQIKQRIWSVEEELSELVDDRRTIQARLAEASEKRSGS